MIYPMNTSEHLMAADAAVESVHRCMFIVEHSHFAALRLNTSITLFRRLLPALIRCLIFCVSQISFETKSCPVSVLRDEPLFSLHCSHSRGSCKTLKVIFKNIQ